MAWSQTLVGSASISDQELGFYLDELDAPGLDGIYGSKWWRTDWGWQSECDIQRDRDGNIYFHGGGASWYTTLPQGIAALAKAYGKQCSLGERS